MLPETEAIASISQMISQTICRLRALSQSSIQSQWRWCQEDRAPKQALLPQAWDTWAIAPLNEKQHIAWERGRRVLWLGQRLVIPATLGWSEEQESAAGEAESRLAPGSSGDVAEWPGGYPLEGLTLRLALTWWAELAQVFVDGQLVQEGDLFDHSARIVLRERVQPGQEVAIALRLVSPDHDNGALVRSLCLYERPEHSLQPCPEPGFVADELAVVLRYLEAGLEPDAPGPDGSVAELAAIATQLPWSALRAAPTLPHPFDQAIADLRQQLLRFSAPIQQRKIFLLGHAHLDLAWLWPVSETWEVAERTFQSVLNLMAEFPELTFCHSSPALFAWIETHRPVLFAEIQAQVAAGRWEMAAGMWVEPELNLIGAEAIARQILYGQRYCQEKFGRISRIAWLPDTFGFPWQLPQFLRQGGVEYFVTQKLRWNDTTQFPYEVFGWQAPDGSRVFSLHSAPIGEGIDPLKMVDYACQFEQKTGLRQALWLVGVGDHGGGPSRDMLELSRRWGRSPCFPQLEFTTAERYLDEIAALSPPASLPLWKNELYLEFHRGCYTTHADQKRWNRRCEDLLYQAELFAAFATLSTGAAYPKDAIETAWKRVLFNQFHDILPGSAIAPVYADANSEWQAAEQSARQILEEALAAIAAHIQLPPPPHPEARALVIFNPSNWERSQFITHSINFSTPLREADRYPEEFLGWHVCHWDGQRLPVQECAIAVLPSEGDRTAFSLGFQAESIPALGYRCFWICPNETQAAATVDSAPAIEEGLTLENPYLRVVVDGETGNLTRVFDKRHQREILSGPGNVLQAFRDEGQYWDAWNIDPDYAQKPLPAAQLLKLHPRHPGPQGDEITVRYRLGNSLIYVHYQLGQNDALLTIHLRGSWIEQHTLLKAAFPLNLEADFASYDMPAGTIQRSTRPQTPAERAQWEVPALRWADLSSATGGVSVLSNYKFGYDCQPSQIRLSLLRGSQWPDENADFGLIDCTYALYPHDGDWRRSHTLRRARELTQPLHVRTLLLHSSTAAEHLPVQPASLPAVGQFFRLDADNLILTAFKQSEVDPQQWILRCYEGHGAAAELRWGQNFGWGSALPCGQPSPQDGTSPRTTNLLESGTAMAAIAPWQVATFILCQGRSPSPGHQSS